MLRAVTLVALMFGVAHADGAESRFRNGRQLLKAGKVAEACAEFASSRDLEARSGTLLNLGDCQERLGDLAGAHAAFVEAAALANRAGDTSRAAEAKRRAAAIDLPRTAFVIEPQPAVELAPTVPDAVELVIANERRGAIGVPARTLGVGVMLGAAAQRENAIVGARVVGAWGVPHGELRVVGSVSYSRYPDEPETDPSLRTTTLSMAGGAHYVWLPHARFGLGAGIGLGADYDFVNMKGPGRHDDLGTFWAVHASPAIVRLRDGAVELGLHVTAQVAGDELVVNAIAALDWYLW